ncbi:MULTISPECIES: DNA-directed RNA polymerase subunit delta [unclassified Granulicatella]|uniref:DNA-directed RNA polymerase subunit delta n=1 Tax=unclassified Granulicatella TaxID=2630493 RepID=UPI0010733671|nr:MULTISPECIES: DNA-directed RNA polymerase subunit delta [unclassified Granulicatella]MBF0780458.1 DNA-directed RNA polymerase subunit delta [Granulicatella sp. 19428wC4_WM01]TFU95402.1 DNA-directed RNA polymerase subunit delta [Granulicatella sp. WM01]
MLNKFDGLNKKELSMIEVAHAILEEKKDVMEFNDLLVAVQEYLELSEEELDARMSIFYTELNTDGSFISLGDNRWGLRSWYPIDSIDEELVSALEENNVPRRKKRKKINAFVTSDDDVDYSNDDPEDMDDLDDDIDSDDLDDMDEELIEYRSDLSELDPDDDFDSPSIEDDLTVVSDDEIFDDI